jgi:membrane protein DedA with SNARE-associated domain
MISGGLARPRELGRVAERQSVSSTVSLPSKLTGMPLHRQLRPEWRHTVRARPNAWCVCRAGGGGAAFPTTGPPHRCSMCLSQETLGAKCDGIQVAEQLGMDVGGLLALHGTSVVFANVLAQQLGLPIPAEPRLIVAGTLAAKGLLSPFQVIAATVLATVLADPTWVLVGRRYEGRLARLASWWDRGSGKGSERVLGRWGLRSLLLARFVPGAVQLIVPMAGAQHVSFRSFVLYDLTGIVVWASVPVTAGMVFGRQADVFLQALSRGSVWLGVAALIIAAALLFHRRQARGRR